MQLEVSLAFSSNTLLGVRGCRRRFAAGSGGGGGGGGGVKIDQSIVEGARRARVDGEKIK